MALDRKLTREIVANLVIAIMIVGLVGIAFSYDTHDVFSGDHEKPIYHGASNTNKVSLMFNVYWGTEYIDGILDVLDRYDVKTTFFIGGMWAEKNSDMLRKIYDRGHEIGNHGYFHKDMDKLDYKSNVNEIEPNNLLIESIIGIRPKLFAPPSGAFNNDTLKAVTNAQMLTIMWSKDTIDWRDKDTAVIFKRAVKAIGGDLILAHPTKNTLEALPMILKHFIEHDLEVVKVSECVGMEV